MSKIGRQPIIIPQGVTVEVKDGIVNVSGPHGSLARPFPSKRVTIALSDGKAEVRSKESMLWGTWRSHVANMVEGVSKRFVKELEIQGVGYRVSLSGKTLTFALGFSHPVNVEVPEIIQAEVKENIVTLTSAHKEALGQFASYLRSLRPPDPYKGKGVRYVGEVLKLKPGKKVGATSA